MGGNKKKLQTQAQTTAGAAVEENKAGAARLQTELEKRRGLLSEGLPETLQAGRTAATNLATGGGYTPVNPDLSGRGRDTFENLAVTGGFNPEQEQQFVRASTAPVKAVYSQAQDDLERQKAIQGGYSPGFTASQKAITRNAAGQGADATLAAKATLADKKRQGMVAGATGLATTRAQAGSEALTQSGQVQQGKIAGAELLQRYSQFGVAALSQTDITDLQNRLQTGNISMEDAQLLTQLAAQNKSLFDNIMQGIQTIGGATAGVLTGVGGLH